MGKIPPNSFHDTEESNTKLADIQLKLDTAKIAAKCVSETEESYTELGGIQIELDTAKITYKNYVTETEESNM